MQDCDIILFKVNHWNGLPWYRKVLAKAIQLIDRNYYHHAGVFIEGKIHEAEAKGVVESDLDKHIDHQVCILKPIKSLTEAERRRMTFVYKQLIGKKYDYMGTLLFQLIYRLTQQRLWIGTTHNSATRKLYCSEHVVLGYSKVLGFFPQPWKVSPGDIRRSSGYFYVHFEGSFKEYITNNFK